MFDVGERRRRELGITTPTRPTGPPDPEVRVLRWSVADDGIPDALERAFYNEERFLALPDDIILIRSPSAPSDPTARGFYFVRRDGDRHVVEAPERPLPGIPRHIHVDEEGVAVDGANFGDGGLGYVFLRDDDGDDSPMALFFWDCL